MVGRRERRELQPAVGLEALDRLEQSDQRHLAEVVGGLAAVRESSGEELGETHVLLDQLVAQVAVARAAVLGELLVRVSRVGHPVAPPEPRLSFITEKPDLGVVLVRLVEVGHGVDDRARKLAEWGERATVTAGGAATGDHRAPDGAERQRDLLIGRRHEQVAQLVDRDAEVLDLVVVEAGAAGGVGRDQAHRAQELGEGRDREPDVLAHDP